MELKLKFTEWQEAINALRIIAGAKLPLSAVPLNISYVNPIMDAYEKAKKALVDAHVAKDEAGQPKTEKVAVPDGMGGTVDVERYVYDDSDQKKAYLEGIQELNEAEHTLDLKEMPLSFFEEKVKKKDGTEQVEKARLEMVDQYALAKLMQFGIVKG